jgi:Flp pilus assembly pilin Flp
MVKLFHRFLKDDSGVSSIQYAFIAISISVAIIVSVSGLEPKQNTTFSTLGSAAGMLTRLVNE